MNRAMAIVQWTCFVLTVFNVCLGLICIYFGRWDVAARQVLNAALTGASFFLLREVRRGTV